MVRSKLKFPAIEKTENENSEVASRDGSLSGNSRLGIIIVCSTH